MIDEKKLIEELLHNDRMNFTVKLDPSTAEGVGVFVREYTAKMKEGFIDLINTQPRIGFTSVEEGLPTKQREYLCRCNIAGHDELPFYMVLRYYLVDENPHFQHETKDGVHVTHWMPIPEPPKVGET